MSMVKRIAHVLIVVLTLIIGATAAAVIVSQTAWFKNWLRGYIIREANTYLNGTLSIERLGGNLFFGVEMENIGVSMDGSQVVAVKDIGLNYNVFQLLTRGLSVDNIRLDKPVIYLRREGDTWSLSRLVKKQETEADRSGPDKPIAIDAIGITDGSIVVESPVGTSGVEVPKRFDHLDAKLSFKYEPVRYSIEITHVSFRGSEPALALNALSGGISVKDDTLFVEKLALRTSETSLSFDGAVQHYLTAPVFNLEISSDKLSLPEIARLVPALVGDPSAAVLQRQGRGAARPSRRRDERAVVGGNGERQAGGRHGGAWTVGRGRPVGAASRPVRVAERQDAEERHHRERARQPAWRGAVERRTRSAARSRSILRASVAAGYVAERIHADARINGRRVSLDGRAAAYGTSATVAGDVVLPDLDTKERTVAYDVHGKAVHLDLRKLPRQLKVPPAATDVNAEYHAVGSVRTSGSSRTLPPAVGTARTSEHEARTSVVSGFSRTVVDLRFQPSTVAGATIAAGSTAGVTLNGSDIAYRADATVADLDLERLGREFNVPALATERYRSSINGHVAASGRGTTPATLDVTANGTLTDSSILGGTIPQLAFDASVARDTAHVKANGSFAGFDPAVATGKPEVKGSVAGTLAVDATVAHLSSGVTPESVEADAKLTLQPSTIGGLEITRASLDGAYHDSTGDIRTLDITGRDINVQASGTLALNDTGQSNLKIHADSPSLEQIGKLVNQPITGIGKIDATVTGNRHELKAAGNLVGNSLKYRRQRRARGLEQLQRDRARTDGRRRERHRRYARHVRVGWRPGHQRARREDQLSPEAARLRCDREAAAAVAWRGRLTACCTLTIRKSTCSALDWSDAGADVAAGARDRRRPSTTRKTPSRCRT